jgi:hypothetical protein
MEDSMRLARVFAALAAVLVATTAFAAESTLPAKGGREKYGTAGCGVGSLIFGDQPGMVQILAATTNSLFGNQTFGMTTGTLNCGEAAVGTKGAKVFIEANKEALAKDASRGSGETIATLSHLAGCKDAKAVGKTLQRNYKTLFPAADAKSEVVTENVLSTLRSEKTLACTELG